MPPAVMLVVIVALAVVVTMLVNNQINKQNEIANNLIKQTTEAQNQTSSVVVAKADIPEGAMITADSVEVQQTQTGKIPMGAASDTGMVIGRNAKYLITSGQVVCTHDLAPVGGAAGFEAKIPQGYRAVTFGVDSSTGVAGFVAPGSHVDIIATAGSGANTKAAPILSDVEVIAAGSSFQKQAGGGSVTVPTVTVAVKPEDANVLVKGVSAGKLWLTMRREKDSQAVATVDVTSLFDKPAGMDMTASGGPILPPPPSPISGGGDMGSAPDMPPPLHQVEIWTGGKQEMREVPKS
jgi:pilus assembly protein CpaB